VLLIQEHKKQSFAVPLVVAGGGGHAEREKGNATGQQPVKTHTAQGGQAAGLTQDGRSKNDNKWAKSVSSALHEILGKHNWKVNEMLQDITNNEYPTWRGTDGKGAGAGVNGASNREGGSSVVLSVFVLTKSRKGSLCCDAHPLVAHRLCFVWWCCRSFVGRSESRCVVDTAVSVSLVSVASSTSSCLVFVFAFCFVFVFFVLCSSACFVAIV